MDETERRRRWGREALPVHSLSRPCFWLAVLSACLLWVVGCAPDVDNSEVEFQVPVTVETVTTGDVEDRIVTTGTLRAPESVVLVAESPGRLVVARHASGRRLAEGDRVKAGQPIAEITGEDARLAARTESTKHRYEMAEQELNSRRRLFADGVISEETLKKAEVALADAKLEWERSQLTENRNQVVTPISGVILKLARGDDDLPAADGQLVVPNFTIAKVAPVDTLVADIDLVGPDLAKVLPGQEVRVRHYAWAAKTFPGTVIRLAPTIDPNRHTFQAEVEVRNPDELLLPGMFVEVTLVAERREDVPVVPRQAVTERGGKPVVFRVNGQRAERLEVVLGLGDDEQVEVRQGPEPGDRVVVRGLETLTDSAKIRVAGQGS